MTRTSQEFERRRFAWARTGFDVEGLVGAGAALLVGILLGVIWGPLFWLGAIAAVVILFATRRATRVPPADEGAIVAPVDGVVVSVEGASPPSELRFGMGEAVRIRIASAPSSRNGVYAPIAGELETVIVEPGDTSVVIAVDADAHGLATAYLTFKGDAAADIGVRLATGGLGPRLDIGTEAGDPVRLGRKIGQRRLGGWCDVYVAADAPIAVWPGMTLVGAETRLVTTVPGDDAEAFSRDELAAHQADIAPPMPDEDTGAGVSEKDKTEETATDDPAELFARLRSKVEEASKTDDTPGEDETKPPPSKED